jgi:hypothetical protein
MMKLPTTASAKHWLPHAFSTPPVSLGHLAIATHLAWLPLTLK